MAPVRHLESQNRHISATVRWSLSKLLNAPLPVTSVPTARWYSETDVQEADEGMSSLLLLMREPSSEWAWFSQCDVTLHHGLLAAHFVVFCLFVVHVTSVTSVTSVSRSVHDSSQAIESLRALEIFLPAFDVWVRVGDMSTCPWSKLIYGGKLFNSSRDDEISTLTWNNLLTDTSAPGDESTN